MKTRTIAFFAAFLVFSSSFIVTVPFLGAGAHKLRVRITSVVNNHAMNLEKIVLVPAK